MRRLIDALARPVSTRDVGQPPRRARLRARRPPRRRRARSADDLRLRHRGRPLPRQRELHRARAPPPHAEDRRAGARLVRGLADPGRLRRGSRHRSTCSLVDTAPGVPAKVDANTRSRLRGRCAPCAAPSTSCAPRPIAIGDAWLRVFVREPTRAGLADDVRAILPRAVDVRVERPDDGERRRRFDASGAAAGSHAERAVRRVPRERGRRGSARRAPVPAVVRRRHRRGARLMRPVLLHAEGFGVFRDAVDVDFDGVDYFALVGPTGAGQVHRHRRDLLRAVRQRAPLRRRAAGRPGRERRQARRPRCR